MGYVATCVKEQRLHWCSIYTEDWFNQITLKLKWSSSVHTVQFFLKRSGEQDQYVITNEINFITATSVIMFLCLAVSVQSKNRPLPFPSHWLFSSIHNDFTRSSPLRTSLVLGRSSMPHTLNWRMITLLAGSVNLYFHFTSRRKFASAPSPIIVYRAIDTAPASPRSSVYK